MEKHLTRTPTSSSVNNERSIEKGGSELHSFHLTQIHKAIVFKKPRTQSISLEISDKAALNLLNAI